MTLEGVVRPEDLVALEAVRKGLGEMFGGDGRSCGEISDGGSNFDSFEVATGGEVKFFSGGV